MSIILVYSKIKTLSGIFSASFLFWAKSPSVKGLMRQVAKYYPINLALENKKCVVIGAGKVAQRKVKRLLESGAKVWVISPEITPALKALAKKKKIIFKDKRVILKDLNGAYLIIAATADRRINSAVASYCRKKGILINVVDSPKECNFILPAIIRRGALTISISTEGISPALSRKIRQDLGQRFGGEYAKILRIMKKIRPQALKKIKNSQSRKAFFKKALQPEAFDLLRRSKSKQAKIRLERILEDAGC